MVSFGLHLFSLLLRLYNKYKPAADSYIGTLLEKFFGVFSRAFFGHYIVFVIKYYAYIFTCPCMYTHIEISSDPLRVYSDLICNLYIIMLSSPRGDDNIIIYYTRKACLRWFPIR